MNDRMFCWACRGDESDTVKPKTLERMDPVDGVTYDLITEDYKGFYCRDCLWQDHIDESHIFVMVTWR